MIKKINWLIILFVSILFLSGCTFPWTKPITKIVYQEDKTIDSLQDFLSEAQIIADKQIGEGAQLKIIYYSYFDGDFSYDAAYAKDGEILKSGVVKNITISYNKEWEAKKEGSILSHVSKDSLNNKIIAIECNNSKECAGGVANTMADPKNNIDTSKIKIPLSTFLDDKYSTGYDHGFIRNINGIPFGKFGRFTFNMITGDFFDGANEGANIWYEKQASLALNTTFTVEIHNDTTNSSTADILTQNFNNDLDKDGLTNLQEAGYGTAPGMGDTDSDGHSDSEEINNGYSPLGMGEFLSKECLKDPGLENNRCYLERAKYEKDFSICQKISVGKEVFECILSVNLIIKNPRICEDLNNSPENDLPDFYGTCLKELGEMANLVARPFERDTRTIGDVKQIQTALEMYYNDNGKYPSEITEGGSIGTFMSIVPSGLKGKTSNCANNYEYKYSFISDNDYLLSYCIDENPNIGTLKLNLGLNAANPKGIK